MAFVWNQRESSHKRTYNEMGFLSVSKNDASSLNCQQQIRLCLARWEEWTSRRDQSSLYSRGKKYYSWKKICRTSVIICSPINFRAFSKIIVAREMRDFHFIHISPAPPTPTTQSSQAQRHCSTSRSAPTRRNKAQWTRAERQSQNTPSFVPANL